VLLIDNVIAGTVVLSDRETILSRLVQRQRITAADVHMHSGALRTHHFIGSVGAKWFIRTFAVSR